METIKPQAEPEQGSDMVSKRKKSTRKSSTRTSGTKSTSISGEAGKTAARSASSKAAPSSAPRKAATARAVSAARDAATRVVAEKPAPVSISAKPEAPDMAQTDDAVKAAETPPAPGPQGVTAGSVAMNKRALVERVASRAGVRKAQARPLVEAMLAELGEALDRKEILKLQPLGVMRVARVRDAGAAEVMVCKLRRKKTEKGGGDPLAEAAE